MWSSYKNSYLQSCYNFISPELINRSVTKARKLRVNDPNDFQPPLQRLSSHQPPILCVRNIDFTRKRCGYGAVAFKQLKTDLISYDIEVKMRAVTTLGDLLSYPENAIEIIRLNIHGILAHLVEKKDNLLTKSVFKAYAKLSRTPNGRLAIVNTPTVLNCFRQVLSEENDGDILKKLGKCLDNIAGVFTCADELVDQGFIQLVLTKVAHENDDVATIMLSTLRSLMYGNGKYIAMEKGAFPLMISMLQRIHVKVNINALNCLMIMTMTDIGKRMAIDCDLLQTLTILLGYSDNVEIDAAIVAVLMFCTILPKAKERASKNRMLVPKLIKVCRNPLNVNVQHYAFATLVNLAVHNDVRDYLRKKYFILLGKVVCANAAISNLRDALFEKMKIPA